MLSEKVLHRLAWVVVAFCVAPILAAALAAFTGNLEVWRDVLASVLPRYVRTTLILVAIVGLATAVIGSVTAWLVTVYRFPGSRWLEIALALPLAWPRLWPCFASCLVGASGPASPLAAPSATAAEGKGHHLPRPALPLPALPLPFPF